MGSPDAERSSPNGWVWTTIGDVVVNLIGGGTPPRAASEYFGGEITWLTPTEIPKNGILTVKCSRESLTELGLRKSSARLVPTGSVLLTSRATIGNVAIAGKELATNQGFAAFVCPPGLFNLFFAYWLFCNRKLLNDEAKGTTFKEISKSKLRTLKFSLPPLPEQRRIVAKIEELFSDLDAGVEALKKVKAELKRYRQAVLKAAVEGKLTEEWRRGQGDSERGGRGDAGTGRQGEGSVHDLLERIRAERAKNAKGKKLPPIDTSELPKLPEGWEWAKVGDVCDIFMGQSPPGDSYNTEGKGVPLINGPVEFGPSAFSRTLKAKFTMSPTKMCKENDLILCVRGSTTGRMNIAGFDACIGRGVAAMRAFYCQNYLDLYIHSQQRAIFDLGTGSTFPNVSCIDIAGLVIPFPPLAEQQQIVSEVERRLSAADEVEKSVEASLKQADRLRQSILKRAFEGKLVPQDPSDPPASELLEKIRREKEVTQESGKITTARSKTSAGRRAGGEVVGKN